MKRAEALAESKRLATKVGAFDARWCDEGALIAMWTTRLPEEQVYMHAALPSLRLAEKKFSLLVPDPSRA